MSDVMIIVMPYASVEHPAIGPGSLKARLTEENISSEVLYANLRFAEEIGLRMYFTMSNCATSTLLAEWSFAQAAFPDFKPDQKLYLNTVQFPLPDEKLYDLRIQAVDFMDRLAAEILKKNPKIVGCSSIFQQNCASLALLRRIKDLAPDIITVMGGANCEGDLGLAMIRLFPFLDFTVSGEADDSFPALCKLLLQVPFTGPETLNKLPDGVYGAHDRNRTTPDQKQRAVVQNLDTLPPPDFDEYFRDVAATTLRHQFTPGIVFETSRGCWWGQKQQCSFCGLNGEGIHYRRKSADRVYDELKTLGSRHQLWKFEAVDNIVDMKLLEELQPRLSSLPQKPSFFFETKSNLSRQQVRLLRDAGIQWIQPGIETLHDDTLTLLNKGVHSWQNIALLKWAQEDGIHVLWNYLCLIPGDQDDTYAEVAEWIPWIMHLQPPSGPQGTPIMYDRFGSYHRNREKLGLKLQPLSFYYFIYPLPPHEMKQLAYFYEIADPAHYSQKRPGLTKLREQLTHWRQSYFTVNTIDGVRSHGEPSYALTATPIPGGWLINDTRPCAVKATWEWHGLDATVLTVCDTALTLKGIRLHIEKQTGTKADDHDILCSIARLQDARILLRLKDHYIALPFTLPTHPKGRPEDNPAGYLSFAKPAEIKPKGQSILATFGME